MATELTDEAINKALENHTLMEMAKHFVWQYNHTADNCTREKELYAATAGYLLQLAYIRQEERLNVYNKTGNS